MEIWQIWGIFGLSLILLEFIIPGGVVVFLGISGILISLSLAFGLITSLINAVTIWFILSLFLMIVLRSFFMKYFEGDSSIQSVDEDSDSEGAIVEVFESISPYKDGRIKFHGTTWIARSDNEIKSGEKAIIVRRVGSSWIVKSI